MINKIEIRIFENLSYEYKSSQCEGIGDADAIFGPTIQRSGIHFTYSKADANYLPKYFVDGDPSLVIKWLIYHDRNLEFVINKLKEESLICSREKTPFAREMIFHSPNLITIVHRELRSSKIDSILKLPVISI